LWLRCAALRRKRVFSLNGRTPNCQLGRYQFESGRTRLLIYYSLTENNENINKLYNNENKGTEIIIENNNSLNKNTKI
jgi:hypothetical protein